ncbi:MAG: hypothetical protein M0Q43_10425 [Methanothrix sp.]|jgi:hypothetical protein|nr:hypothetical protein [Methanothrix sp.]
MAVTWSFRDAGLVCAVCADLAGLIIVKSGRGCRAGFAARQRRSCGRKGRLLRFDEGKKAGPRISFWGVGVWVRVGVCAAPLRISYQI